MDDLRIKKVISLLQKYDSEAVPFQQAKQEILGQGYTEAEAKHINR